ncbi:mannonate dehydratase [Bauldia sp.]|uniref:mannonate dehydratase n=1 Tax=Bauldia sp. TaxID=2575872 RepID=UPI003BA90845
MEKTWRWFGPDDPIPLSHVREAGATGIVSALHQIPGGTVWTDEAIAERKALIETAGLQWSVVESIPVTNAIKARTDTWRHDIDVWKETLAAIGRAGIDTVCYNFMPIVDWTRTDLAWPLSSGEALRFDIVDFAAYDVFVLQRQDAASSYTDGVLADAEERYEAMPPDRQDELERIILAGLPGSDFAYDRAAFLDLLAVYDRMEANELLQSLTEFLNEVVPVADEHGIRLGIHPDDPPIPLFGLPRIVSTAADAATILDAYDSRANGLTLCAGSYGSRADNDVPEMVRTFAPRINFLHLRNVTIDAPGVFYEAEHLEGSTDMVAVVGAVLDEEDQRDAEGRPDSRIPMRPDHGHLLAGDPVRNANPGYSYVGRLKGLAELNGIIHASRTLRQ